MQNEILEQLDKVIEYYNDMQSDSPDNLSLPNFHNAMAVLIDLRNISNQVERVVKLQITEIIDKAIKNEETAIKMNRLTNNMRGTVNYCLVRLNAIKAEVSNLSL